jgi:hypothetical protein
MLLTKSLFHSRSMGSESTVKLGNKERFDKEQIGIKEPFPVTFCHFLHKDKELVALRNNLRSTKKFLIAKFDCSTSLFVHKYQQIVQFKVSDFLKNDDFILRYQQKVCI